MDEKSEDQLAEERQKVSDALKLNWELTQEAAELARLAKELKQKLWTLRGKLMML